MAERNREGAFMSGYRIHPQARTTPRQREEIRNSNLSERELARVYNTTRATIRRWKYGDAVTDRSHRPQRLTSRLKFRTGGYRC